MNTCRNEGIESLPLSSQRFQTSDVLMLIDFISHHHSDKLGNSGKQQVSMQRFLILGLPASNAKTIFKVVDGFFHIDTYLIRAVPLFCPTGSAWIGTEILFRIDIEHPATGRCCTWVFTMADTPFGLILFVVFPFHFWAYKLHGWESAAQMCFAPFPSHRKGGGFGTAGDAFCIQRAARFRQGKPSIEWDVSFFKRCFQKKVFVDFNGIKSRVTQEDFGIDQWVL